MDKHVRLRPLKYFQIPCKVSKEAMKELLISKNHIHDPRPNFDYSHIYQLEIFSNRWQVSISYTCFFHWTTCTFSKKLLRSAFQAHLVLPNISPKYDPNEFCTIIAPNSLQNFLKIIQIIQILT